MQLEDEMLTHIDQKNRPTMVDVTEKKTSLRMAQAETKIQLPESMRPFFSGEELVLKKGPVFQTAIIAGTMAVKKTHELIPFCHQIPVESCKFEINVDENLLVTITCKVKTVFKTGVEMEALHGATIAALTIYDMCKAISHDMVLKETKLISKTGGKHTMLDRPTYGLVLTGGQSKRMGEAKALIDYNGKPHAEYIYDVLNNYCDKVFLSAREGQWKGTPLEKLPMVFDKYENEGPMGGMLSAFDQATDVNWVVIACDLIHFNDKTIQKLLAGFNKSVVATCYKNTETGFPEPLCALYTPSAQGVFMDAFMSNVRCPVKVLKNIKTEDLHQEEGINLANINTQEEKKHAVH
jgi:cyclic pyranopterin monophosphate synthase